MTNLDHRSFTANASKQVICNVLIRECSVDPPINAGFAFAVLFLSINCVTCIAHVSRCFDDFDLLSEFC